ncbi:hypothetical protein PT974_05422 [Cladobotryum mycophilum]|uniref:Uncharacterized protein n=1 Tax=Cladobotryum mycophilum TaxID=491253 RepID=A0ABR0SJL1_9HYPO
MTAQLEQRFAAASNTDYSFTHPNASYHGPTDDLLTCEGICHSPRPLSLAALDRALADSASRTAATPCSSGTLVWLRMSRAVLRKPSQLLAGDTSSSLPTSSSPKSDASLFAWSTPEGAAKAVTGTDCPLLSLPLAVCAPLSGEESSSVFHPAWVEEGLGTITAQAAGGLCYLSLHRPEEMSGTARTLCAFFNGLPYGDELGVADQGGQWSEGLGNIAGPLLAAEKLLDGLHPKLFERVLLGYHCCTVRLRQPVHSVTPSLQTLFLARFYDSALISFIDCFKFLDPGSVLTARAAGWGILLSNDVLDYVSDGLSGRAANLCWAIGRRDSPVQCARMFRGCVLAIAAKDIPLPDAVPVTGFRAALRAVFCDAAGDVGANVNTPVNESGGSLPPWQGLAATPCEWDEAPEDFDVVSTRAIHDILGCLDRGIYANSPGLYRAHLAWLIRQYDALVLAGRDNLAVGRYYATHRLTPKAM